MPSIFLDEFIEEMIQTAANEPNKEIERKDVEEEETVYLENGIPQ